MGREGGTCAQTSVATEVIDESPRASRRREPGWRHRAGALAHAALPREPQRLQGVPDELARPSGSRTGACCLSTARGIRSEAPYYMHVSVCVCQTLALCSHIQQQAPIEAVCVSVSVCADVVEVWNVENVENPRERALCLRCLCWGDASPCRPRRDVCCTAYRAAECAVLP